ncbi:FUSC family protein [Paenibacillus donghaensis]|nr:FUSC family protein [Paenibacillus donghaensis]
MNEGLQDRLEKYGLSLYMIRITLAASLSWIAVHSLYGDGYLYFAPLAAILITQSTVKASFEKGIYRMIGIILGGVVSLVVGQFLDVGALSILLILLIGIGVATACRINIQAVSQVGVTSVLALTFYQDHYVMWRVAETLIGVLIALAINMIVVPPKGFIKVKSLVLDGSLLLADALRALVPGSRDAAQAKETLAKAGARLSRSVQQQKEMHFTVAHVQCRGQLSRLSITTGHMKVVQTYVQDIHTEMKLLPRHHAASDWMAEVLQATADCIGHYATSAFGGADNQQPLADALRKARALQQQSFADLQGNCSLNSIRDLGAVFSHLNRVLDEIERAEYAATQIVPRPVAAEAARALFFLKKGLSHKL